MLLIKEGEQRKKIMQEMRSWKEKVRNIVVVVMDDKLLDDNYDGYQDEWQRQLA